MRKYSLKTTMYSVSFRETMFLIKKITEIDSHFRVKKKLWSKLLNIFDFFLINYVRVRTENLTLINRLPSVGDSQVNSVGIINVSMDND